MVTAHASVDRLVPHVERVRSRHYPELGHVHVELRPFASRWNFLAADVCRRTLTREPAARTYVMRVRVDFAVDPPPEPALDAILAHELAHVRDYLDRTVPGLLGLALRYALDGRFRCRYEREADLRVVERGLGRALGEYRRWLYGRLPTRVVRRKRKLYLTPEELDSDIMAPAAGVPGSEPEARQGP